MNDNILAIEGVMELGKKEITFWWGRPAWMVRYALRDWIHLWVGKDWWVWSDDVEWKHPKWGVCKRGWTKINFGSNWHGYRFTNISWRAVGKKHLSITQHRLVYAAYNGLDYWGGYSVYHLNWDVTDNRLENLYVIYDTKSKESLEHKRKAYKLLEMYMRWELVLDAKLKAFLD